MMRILPGLVIIGYAAVFCALGGMMRSGGTSATATPEPPRHMVVVTPPHEYATSRLTPFGPGYDRELLQEFCRIHGYRVTLREAQNREEALALLQQGKADLAMGFGGDVTPPAGVAAGPDYYHAIRVTALLPASSVRHAGSPTEGIRHWLDRRSWRLWEPFAPLSKVVEREALGERRVSYHWLWRTAPTAMHLDLQGFWADLLSPENQLLDELEELYYGYLPRTANPDTAVDMRMLVEERLPRYRDMIINASRKVGIDPVLFTAVVIQESRLDEGTVSHTGVRGIMQLTSRTAAFLRVDRMDPKASLEAGARYLHMLWKQLEPLQLDDWDRWFFTLAAFNQGPRRLEGAVELARKLGGSGRTWAELKKVYPLLSQKKYADMIGQSTCRGAEAVAFVARVRWSYHFLHGLLVLGWPEAENLAPLLGDVDFRTFRRRPLQVEGGEARHAPVRRILSGAGLL